MCASIQKQPMVKEQLINITIRGRFLFGLCALQKAINHWHFDNLNWQMLFDFLIKYPNGDQIRDLVLWHENQAECIPFCVLDDQPYEECMFEFISKIQYEYFKDLYNQTNKEVCEIIDLTAQVGTQSLYGGVRDGSPITIEYLNRIINILEKNNIEIPNLNDFDRFIYESAETDWIVWGDKIEIEVIEKFLNSNKTSK